MPVKRQKRDLLLDLSTKSMRDAASSLPDHLDTLPTNLAEFETVILEFLRGLARSNVFQPPSKQASSLSLIEVSEKLNIDYKKDVDHVWSLPSKPEQPHLSALCFDMIKKIQESPYFRNQHPESLTRTVVDILLCDRLEVLADVGANHQLQVYSEVAISTKVKNQSSGGYITGRADWVLGWGDKTDIQHVSLIIEAKTEGLAKSAVPQLFAYLAGVQDARRNEDKHNSHVFGLATDSDEFYFVILRGDQKAFVSRPLTWILDQGKIIEFLDHILRSAIEASPSTTPVKTGNITTAREHFPKYLGRVFVFGNENSEEDEGDGVEYNVIEEDGVSLLERC